MTDDADGQEYWLNTSDTFVADEGYYASVDRSIRALVMPHLSPDASVLDIGCGEGRFTAVLASGTGHVDAFDLSPRLVAAAKDRGLPNVVFSVGDARDLTAGSYDVVSCMGVLVCMVDDDSFLRTLRGMAEAVRPGGLLLLRETFSGWGRRVVSDGGYPACYRTRGAYLHHLDGFELVADERLATWSRLRRRSNHLWLLRRTD